MGESQSNEVECPLDREELGQSTWGLLHTWASTYPNTPTEQQQKRMETFFEILSEIYPCPYCREDFARHIEQSPPKVSSREALSIWLCEQHNLVNMKLGKKVFPCSLSKLDMRWKEGHSNCWSVWEESE